MSSQKPRRRFAAVLWDRLLPAVLIIACMVVGVQVTGALVERANDAALHSQRQPAYQATATAMQAARPTVTATPAPSITPTPRVALPDVNTVKDAAWVLARQDIFATNTPQAAAGEPTASPSPTAAAPLPTDAPFVTPRPLPTLWIYAEPPPANIVPPTAIPTAFPIIDRQYDLMNVLLLGSDGEITADGIRRTDTMIIVSINRDTGSVSLLSLPRDLFVYIPGWTMQRLNLAYIHGVQVGWSDGGFGLLRQTILYNLGINVHYYAMVDLEGFKAIVDAVGGIDIPVDCAIQDLPLIASEVPSAAIRVTDDGEYALPVGYYAMNGAEALWYARSRGNSSDFDRGRRQQQILRAVWRKARDSGLLNTLPSLWAESQAYIETNLTLEDLIPLIPLATSLNTNQIESYTFRRLYHTTPWTPPDGSNVQLPNPQPVFELMTAFYTPATLSQIASEGARVHVYNGTTIPNLDLVAADRLNWEGIGAVAMGTAPQTDLVDSTVTDYTGRSKGSSLGEIATTLNVLPQNIEVEPSGSREADFVVVLGANYNSCTEGGVLPVTQPE
ncbi:MAG: LCP family protein [bacterium]|nr:LCP family protein [bacterium]